MKILITCGYNQSKHTILLINRLIKDGINIKKVLIVRTLNFKRIKYYYHWLSPEVFYHKVRDRIFGSMNFISNSIESEYVLNDLKNENVYHKTVTSICNANNISYTFVNDLNSKKKFHKFPTYDLGIYCGGGILGNNFLSNFKIGVLNCHAGKLPNVRGMNSSEWSLFLGLPIINTVHFIVRKIDMGPIIYQREIDISNCKSLNDIRGIAVCKLVEDLINAIKLVIKDDYELIEQSLEDGLQYFNMHSIIKNIITKNFFAK
jgi:hypothetical protein